MFEELPAGGSEAQCLILKMSSRFKRKWKGEAEEKKKEKIVWHEKFLVNNLQGHTERVRPTKTK